MHKFRLLTTLLVLLTPTFANTAIFSKPAAANICVTPNSKYCTDNTPFDPNTWNPKDWINSGAGELCERNADVTASRNRDRKQGLSPTQKKYLRLQYGSLVDEVTVKWGSLLNDEWTFQGRTVEAGSEAQTYGNIIYIAEKRDPLNPNQLVLLAHEFAHVQQYRRLGNLDNFCREYMTAYANADFIYENNEFEQDADYSEAEFMAILDDTFYDYQGRMRTINHQGSNFTLPVQLPTGYEPTQAEIDNGCTEDFMESLGAETCEEAYRALDKF